MKFEVIHSQWSADGEVYSGGIHDDVELTAEIAPLFAGAADAGSILILKASQAEIELLKGHVEPQKTGERAYRIAQKEGRWQEGNLEQFELDVANGVRSRDL